MTKKSDAPAIRFKGFSDAWEQRKLDEIVSFFNGLTYSPKDIRSTGTLVLRSSNVKDGEVVDADNVYVDPAVVDSENVRDGDIIVVVRNGSRALIGKHAEIKGSKPHTVIGAFMTGIRSEHPSFLNALLNTPHFDKEVEMNMGATINQITGYMFSKMEFMLPSPAEQDAIGEYFKQLDNLITLHQRKCALLFSPFQALISMMFTTSTFSWEQRKVQDVSDRFDNLRIPVAANLRVHGTTPYYGANGIQDYVEGFTHDGEFVLVAEDGANDLKNYPVKCVNGRIWVNNHAHILQGKAGIADNSFLAFAISQSDIESLLVGGGRAKLNAETLMSIEFRLPCLQEQYRIGEYLTQLDHLITLHQRKYISFTGRAGRLISTVNKKRITSSWEQRKFSDITFPAGEKNRDNLPLESYSITNEHGFVPQDEKFENGGTMREADKRMYYIVSPNSFAYNPARINVGSIGYQNIGKNVIVSSLYEVFKTSEDVDDRLLWHWFKSPDFQELIMQLQEGGVRLYFYYDKLCMGEVSLPSLEEQRKIGKLFDTLDNLITLHQRKGKAAVTGCSNDANNSKGVYCKARDFGYKCYKKVKSQQIRCLIAVFIFFV